VIFLKKETDYEIGQAVKSKAGRDKGRILFVIGIADENYIFVADGDMRRIDKPKMKKVKHLVKLSTFSYELAKRIKNGDKINNAFLRRELEKLGLRS
jgi:ribosomal protein L14E/L6E/L27E